MSPMSFLTEALAYIFTAANWGGPAGLTARILEHLQYTVVAVASAAMAFCEVPGGAFEQARWDAVNGVL